MPEGEGVENVLTKKVGPLPAWGWAVVVGGAGFLYLHYFRKPSATSATPTSTSVPGTGGIANYGYSSGQNLGGADYAPIDSFILGLSDQLNTIQAELGTAQAPPPPTSGPSAGPAPTPAPTPSAPASSAPSLLQQVVKLVQAAWAPGGGAYYAYGWDYYGAGQGVGVNEIAAWINSLYPNAHLSPTQISAWNGGKQFFSAGQQIYVGSQQYGVGH